MSDVSYVWLNGALVDARDARISPFDHGLLVGDGVFETLRVYDGTPFAWRRHCERLAHSARGLGLKTPSREDLQEAGDAVLRANGLREARLRVTVTGGISPLGSERGKATPTVIVAATAIEPPEPSVSIATVPWVRNDRGATTGLKTISYAENVRALAEAHARGASEAVFANTRGEVCEATGSNIFLVFDGLVRTPPPEAGCLLGVTRALVLELGPKLGLPTEEAPIPTEALDRADEAFLTSTTREVQAISHVDGVALGAAPGPITARLAAAFRDLVKQNPDP